MILNCILFQVILRLSRGMSNAATVYHLRYPISILFGTIFILLTDYHLYDLITSIESHIPLDITLISNVGFNRKPSFVILILLFI